MAAPRVGLIVDGRPWTGRLDAALRTTGPWTRRLAACGLRSTPLAASGPEDLEAVFDCAAVVAACDGVYTECGNGLLLRALAQYVRGGGLLVEPVGSPFLFASTARGLVPRLDLYATLFELTLEYLEEDRAIAVTTAGRGVLDALPSKLSELCAGAIRPLCLHPAVQPDIAWIVTDTGEAVLAEHAVGSGSVVRWSAAAHGSGGLLARDALVRIVAQRLHAAAPRPLSAAPGLLVDPIADPPDRLIVAVAPGQAPLRVRVDDAADAHDIDAAGISELKLSRRLTEPVDVIVDGPLGDVQAFACEPEPTAAIRPLEGPAPLRPPDFREFWAQALSDLATAPLDVRWGEAHVDRHRAVVIRRLSFASANLLRVDGILCTPEEQAGDLPGVLALPGYGSGAAAAAPEELAERGFAVLAITLRGVGTRARAPRLESGGLLTHRLERPQGYGYRGAILDCVRAVELLAGCAGVDSQRLATWGVSQGGGLALITAALEPRVGTVVAQVPFLCDIVRAAAAVDSEPLAELRRWIASRPDGEQAARERLGYFDAANFAPDIDAATLITRSWRDDVAPAAALDIVIDRMPAPPTVWEHDEGHLAPALLVHRIACADWLAARLHARAVEPSTVHRAG